VVAGRGGSLEVHGIDVLVRGETHIPVLPFDGRSIPHPDRSFDVVLFVDVLHHTDDPTLLLREAARVARRCIILKDHTRDGLLAGPTLRFMDRVGNARHGVTLPYNYWPKARWLAAFEQLGLTIEAWHSDLHLYPWWADWMFGRSLHFLARISD
jgi:SAM-dependent methyltransferase